jgi:cell wall assembly regulator SMI1
MTAKKAPAKAKATPKPKAIPKAKATSKAKVAPKAKATSKVKAPAKAKAAAGADVETRLARIEAKAKKGGVTLRKGASEKAIAKAEKALGLALPDEVKAFYRRHDGSDDDGAVDGRELLSLERMVSEWTIWKDLLDEGTFEDNDHGEPGRGVQKRWWIPEWVPVTYDYSGNHHVIDLAPAKGGTHGQVLSFWHDEASREVEAKSFLAWLADKAKWGAED